MNMDTKASDKTQQRQSIESLHPIPHLARNDLTMPSLDTADSGEYSLVKDDSRELNPAIIDSNTQVLDMEIPENVKIYTVANRSAEGSAQDKDSNCASAAQSRRVAGQQVSASQISIEIKSHRSNYVQG